MNPVNPQPVKQGILPGAFCQKSINRAGINQARPAAGSHRFLPEIIFRQVSCFKILPAEAAAWGILNKIMNSENRLPRRRAGLSWPEVLLPASADLADFRLALKDLFRQLQESVNQPAAKDKLERFKQICQQHAEAIRASPDLDIDQLSERLQQYWSNLVIVVRWMVTVPGQFEKLLKNCLTIMLRSSGGPGPKRSRPSTPNCRGLISGLIKVVNHNRDHWPIKALLFKSIKVSSRII